jgi:hypothetical protein
MSPPPRFPSLFLLSSYNETDFALPIPTSKPIQCNRYPNNVTRISDDQNGILKSGLGRHIEW